MAPSDSIKLYCSSLFGTYSNCKGAMELKDK